MKGSRSTESLAAADKRFVWHPFTPMRDWCAPDAEPVILAEGRGALLRDTRGREYIDGNASIWTNIHGHSHPAIVDAIQRQAAKLAHASFLGTSNVPAIELAERLVGLFPRDSLTRVFYSDDGSTAMECAVKMAIQFRQLTGEPERREFAAFDQAYHGDTLGAASLGGIDTFHARFADFGLPVRRVSSMDDLERLPAAESDRLAAVAIEPLIQGAAGMRLWPPGLLRRLRDWCDERGVHLILDEVMTGFGRTGTMFACEQEGVTPDFLALAKGLTGGAMPLAATLTRESIFDAFLGGPAEGKTFYYGHSYSGNPLGCAAALASLDVFHREATLARVSENAATLGSLMDDLRHRIPNIRDVRQCGLIAGIEVGDADGNPLPPNRFAGASVCAAARRHGLLTRPIRDTVVLMPPLSITPDELARAVRALEAGIHDAL